MIVIFIIGQLVDVINLLKRCGFSEIKWDDLGLNLGLLQTTLEAIERNNHGDVSRCLTRCLSQWLRRADNVDSRGGATWDSLSTALRSMNEVAVADELSEFIGLAAFYAWARLSTLVVLILKVLWLS